MHEPDAGRWFFRSDWSDADDPGYGYGADEESEGSAGSQKKGYSETVKQMYESAVRCGMSKHDFFHGTMNDVRYRMESFRAEMEDRARYCSNLAWMTGMYVMHSIASTFGKGKYPENPVAKEESSLARKAKRAGKSEEELSSELLYMSLRVREANAHIQALAESLEDNQSNG